MIDQGNIFLGSMTGTSMDGLDLVAVNFTTSRPPELLHQKFIAYPDDLRSNLMQLSLTPEASLSDACRLDAWLGEFYAQSINSFIIESSLDSDDIVALGSHGQTIRHNISSQHPYTLQIGDPNIITARTGLTVVADFRRKDVALGGQGAPLAPAFHQQVFRSRERDRVIINIGGIANITLLPADTTIPVTGFDTGPGNTLLDHICAQKSGLRYDKDGATARSGNIFHPALQQMLKLEPYFEHSYPKSTGTDYFSPEWLSRFSLNECTSADQLATLTELTAITISNAILSLKVKPDECYACGGGVHNSFLMDRLDFHLKNIPLNSTAKLGLNPDWIEAITFAWLAQQTLNHKNGNLPSVTNAHKFTILGGIYQ